MGAIGLWGLANWKGCCSETGARPICRSSRQTSYRENCSPTVPRTPSLGCAFESRSDYGSRGLTKAGRALDKHGVRPNSPFPKATGSTAKKNIQGQFQLDDILTHPNSVTIKDGIGFEIYAPDGRGAYFYNDGSFRGFIEAKYEKIHF